jgi:hypothetical protein
VVVDEDRSGVLLIRVWLEHGSDGFRARLSALRPAAGAEGGKDDTVAVASSPWAASVAVHEWLREFLRPDSHGRPAA